jgi:hypothetical protein
MNLTADDVGSVSIRKLLARMCNQPTLLATSLQANGDSILWDDVTRTSPRGGTIARGRGFTDEL